MLVIFKLFNQCSPDEGRGYSERPETRNFLRQKKSEVHVERSRFAVIFQFQFNICIIQLWGIRNCYFYAISSNKTFDIPYYPTRTAPPSCGLSRNNLFRFNFTPAL